MKLFDIKKAPGVVVPTQRILTFTAPPGGVLDPAGVFKNSPLVPSPSIITPVASGRFLVSDGNGGIKFSTPNSQQYGFGGWTYSTNVGANETAVGLGSGATPKFLFTPTSTGVLFVSVNFAATEPVGSFWTSSLWYGDTNGTPASPAPAQGADIETATGSTLAGPIASIPTTTAVQVNTVEVTVPIFGLTLGHQYWLDVGIKNQGVVQNVTVSNFYAIVAEL